jgi:hypothetical protein
MMLQPTLASELEGMTPTDSEATAIQNLVTAYGNYAQAATALSPLLPAGLQLGKTAMQAALTGMSSPGAALASVPAAIIAFWAAVAGGLAASFAGATVIVPPPQATLISDFPSIMAANKSGSLSLAAAAAAVATSWHTNAIVGGTVTTPPSIVTPIL